MNNPSHVTVDVIKLIQRIQYLLDNHQAEDALASINRSGMNGLAIRNARGVCLLRLGQYEPAMTLFRDLVFPDGAFSIPPEMPTLFRTNYITALFCRNYMSIGISLLKEIPDKQHPVPKRLKMMIHQWKHSMPWWQRILFVFGVNPGKPLHFHYPPGDLWIPETMPTSKPREHAA